MKSFYKFQEDASSQAQSAISGSGSFKGSSDATNFKYDRGFKKRPSTGLGNYALDKAKAAGGAVASAAGRGAGRAASAIKDRMGRPRPAKPDGPGKRPDREPNTYRKKFAAAKQQRQLPPGREQRALPPAKEKSMVAKKTAASKQPPQHKQIDARPATTAMSGSRQKPAIKPGTERKALSPAKSNLSRDNQGVQKVNVKVEPQKALPPSEGKPMMSGGARPRIAPKPQKALAPARG